MTGVVDFSYNGTCQVLRTY